MLKKFFHHAFLTAFFCMGLFVLLQGTAFAQGALGGDWAQFLWKNPFGGAAQGTAGEDLAIQFIQNGIRIVKFVVGAIAVLFGTIYVLPLIFSGGKEETITKRKKNFMGVTIAFVLLLIGDTVADVFNPEMSASEKLIDFEAAHDQLRDIANYIKWLVGAILVLIMTISGLKLMTGQGEEEKITKEKRNIVWTGIGMLVMLLASNIVNAIYVVNAPGGEPEVAPTKIVAEEIGGVIRLILVFLGPLAVLLTIYAGFLYLTAMDNEERATKAKNMIVAGITGIVIIYLAYAIVNTLIAAPLVPEIA